MQQILLRVEFVLSGFFLSSPWVFSCFQLEAVLFLKVRHYLFHLDIQATLILRSVMLSIFCKFSFALQCDTHKFQKTSLETICLSCNQFQVAHLDRHSPVSLLKYFSILYLMLIDYTKNCPISHTLSPNRQWITVYGKSIRKVLFP